MRKIPMTELKSWQVFLRHRDEIAAVETYVQRASHIYGLYSF